MVERRMRNGRRLERHLDDRVAERSPPGSAFTASGCGNIASENFIHASELHQSFVGIGPFTFAVRKISAGGVFAPSGSFVV